MEVIAAVMAFLHWALHGNLRGSKIVLLGILLLALHFDIAVNGAGIFVGPLIFSLALDGVWPFTTIVYLVVWFLRPVLALFGDEESYVSAPTSPKPLRLQATRWYDEEDCPRKPAAEATSRPAQQCRPYWPWYGRRAAAPRTTEVISAEEFSRRRAETRRTSTIKTADDLEREAIDKLPVTIAGVIARVSCGVFFARSSVGQHFYVDVFSQHFSYDYPPTYSWPLANPSATPTCHVATTAFPPPPPPPRAAPAAPAATGPTTVPNPLANCATASQAGEMIHEWLQHPDKNILRVFAGLSGASFRDANLLRGPKQRLAFIGLADKMAHISSFYSSRWAHLVSVDKDEIVCAQMKWMGLRSPLFNQVLGVLHAELGMGRESVWRGTPVERAYQAMSELEEKLPHWLE